MPYKSKAQQAYLHARKPPGVDLAEWDRATKKQKGGFKKLPERVGKSAFGPQHSFEDVAKLSGKDKNNLQAGALGTAGTAGILAAANQRRVGEFVGARHHARGVRQLATAKERQAVVTALPRPTPPSGVSWAQQALRHPMRDDYGARLGPSAYKRRFQAEHAGRLRSAAGQVSRAQGMLRKTPKVVEGAAATTRWGGAIGGGLLLAAAAHQNAKPSKPLVPKHVRDYVSEQVSRAPQRSEPKTTLKKYTDRQVEGGALGAGAGVLAYQEPSYRSKGWEKRRYNDVIARDPELSARLAEHKAAHGIGPNHRAGGREWVPFHRNYPKDLPGWKFKRALSWTHGGKAGVAAQTAAAGLGAAAGAGIAGHLERRREPTRTKPQRRQG